MKKYAPNNEGESLICGWISKNLIHIDRQPVGDHQFFEKPPQHQFQPVSDLSGIKLVFHTKLWQEARRSLNGARNQLWKKGHIERKNAKMFFRLPFAVVDIDGVGERLERVERDTHRQ